VRLRGNDSGALGIHWLVKLAVALGVLGVLGYDTFVTVATHLKAENDAQNAAYAASQAWQDSNHAAASAQTVGTAYQAAITWLQDNEPSKCTAELQGQAAQAAPSSIPAGCDYICVGASNQTPVCGSHGHFTIDPDGTVHLVIRREASTLVFGHLGFMHSLLVAYENGDASTGGG
jgi:hypothetical protein